MGAYAMGGDRPGDWPANLLRMMMAGRRGRTGEHEHDEEAGPRFGGFPFGGHPGPGTHGGRGGPFGSGWPFGPGGPFGSGGPFGPGGPLGDPRNWGRHGWPSSGPPRARRGDVRAAALALLAERPMNGYQIIQEIKERSGGLWKPSSGAVYPALQQLEDEGLVQAGEHEGRRAFALTEAGRKYVEEHPDELAAPWVERLEKFDVDAGVHAMELRELAGQAIGAFVQVALAGTPQQVEQAKQVISEARRALYRILADDDRADDRADDRTDDRTGEPDGER